LERIFLWNNFKIKNKYIIYRYGIHLDSKDSI